MPELGGFVKFFNVGLRDSHKLPRASLPILHEAAIRMGKDNCVYIDGRVRKSIAESIGVSDSQVAIQLGVLVKHGMLYRVGRGYYMVNPYVASGVAGHVVSALRRKWSELLRVDLHEVAINE